MKNLLSLLERFSRSLNKDTYTKEAIIDVVEKHTRVRLVEENISLKEGVLSITASPAAKNEINLRESTIKAELKEARNIFISRVIYH